VSTNTALRFGTPPRATAPSFLVTCDPRTLQVRGRVLRPRPPRDAGACATAADPLVPLLLFDASCLAGVLPESPF